MQKKLNSTVHRDLIKRLVIATMAISVTVVAVAYVIERDRLIKDITFFASQRISQINPHVYDLLDDPVNINVDKLLNRIQGKHGPVQQRTGYFPLSAIYDLQGNKIIESIDPDYPDNQILSEILSSKALLETTTDALIAEPVRAAEQPVLRVGLPLKDRHGKPVLRVVGIYAFSEIAREEFSQRLQRTLLFVMLIVATSAIVLYPVVLNLLRRVEGLSHRLLDANLEIIKTLGGAIAKRDSDTDAHSYRVTLYSVRLAESINADHQTMQGLIKGAFLHDVGKIGTEDRILLKPGKLDDDEFAIMREHVTHGIDIVNRSSWLENAVPIVGCHHEKYDGSGYPNNLQKEEIPLGARIFAIADVFDALTSVRPYKKAFSLEHSLKILIEGRGSHFDPDLLDRFIDLAPELHHHFAGDESDLVREEVAAIVDTYFSMEAQLA